MYSRRYKFIINSNIFSLMTNKIALVNKQIHTRLFQLPQESGEPEVDKKLKKVSLPPQLILKSMIKKGLTATSNSFMNRPKTAQSNFKYSRQNRQTLDRLKSIDSHDLDKKNKKKRYQVPAETPIDFESSKTPKEFQQFDSILERAVRDLKKESQRKRIKLQKYSQQKFSHAWKRFNIPK